MTNWHSVAQLERRGFHVDVVGTQAGLTFDRDRTRQYVSLDLVANPASSQYTAARISEIDSGLPIAQRTKCWQPSGDTAVVAEAVLRFTQAETPPNLTETLIFWNAPFPSYDGGTPPAEAPIPMTAFGVTRNQGVYAATIVQDLDFATFSGLYRVQPMPAWLDPADWHRVRITFTSQLARIEVAQGRQPFSTVLEAELLRAPEPLGFEVSVDNEAFPGVYAPVVVPDSLQLDALLIHAERARS